MAMTWPFQIYDDELFSHPAHVRRKCLHSRGSAGVANKTEFSARPNEVVAIKFVIFISNFVYSRIMQSENNSRLDRLRYFHFTWKF